MKRRYHIHYTDSMGRAIYVDRYHNTWRPAFDEIDADLQKYLIEHQTHIKRDKAERWANAACKGIPGLSYTINETRY